MAADPPIFFTVQVECFLNQFAFYFIFCLRLDENPYKCLGMGKPLNSKIPSVVYRICVAIRPPVESAGYSSRLPTGATLTTCHCCAAGCDAPWCVTELSLRGAECTEKSILSTEKNKPSALLFLSFSLNRKLLRLPYLSFSISKACRRFLCIFFVFC